jgi:urea transport system permease protein
MRRLTDGLAVVLLALTLLLTAQTVLRAANLEEAIAHFIADDYSETDAGIGAVASSGDPRSAALIGALQDGRLLFSVWAGYALAIAINPASSSGW